MSIINFGPKEQPGWVELALQLLNRLFQANHFCHPWDKSSVVPGSPVVYHSSITKITCTTPHKNNGSTLISDQSLDICFTQGLLSDLGIQHK